MKIIIGGRATGKTHRLLEEMERIGPSAVSITASLRSRDHAVGILTSLLKNRRHMSQEKAKRLATQMVVTTGANLKGRRRHIFIDNLHSVLAQYFSCDPSYLEMVADDADTELLSIRQDRPIGCMWGTLQETCSVCGHPEYCRWRGGSKRG